MEMAELFERIADSGLAPPAPPIFATDNPELWDRFGVGAGAEAWAYLVEGSKSDSRPKKLIDRAGWEAVLEAEKVRRAQLLWAVDRLPDGTMRAESERAEIRRLDKLACKDFWTWFHRCGWVENPHASTPDGRVAPLVAWPGQVAYIWWLLTGLQDGIETGREAVQLINKSRAAGVSWSVCHILAHQILFERQFSGKVGSLTGKEVDDGTTYSLMGKIRFIWRHQPTYLLPDYSLEYERMEDAIGFVKARVENRRQKSVIRGENMTRNFGRSGRETVIALDEFAGLTPRLQEEIRTAGTSVSPTTWSFSTPNGKGNRFHKEFVAAPPDQKLTVRWTVDPRRDDAWYEGLLLENGGALTRDQRAQEYGVSFAGISGLRIFPQCPELVPYDEDDREWKRLKSVARKSWLCISGMDFGSGPSPHVCRYALVDWSAAAPHPEYGMLPRLWWDAEVVASREQPEDLAQRLTDQQEPYKGMWRIYGDPAGRDNGWGRDLVREDLPLTCLEHQPFHQPWFIRKSLDLLGEMMRMGLWRVHSTRCPVSMDSEEQWAWDIPENLSVDQVNKSEIKWKKDGPSHACEAGMYGAMAAILYHQLPKPAPNPRQLPGDDALGAELGGLWR